MTDGPGDTPSASTTSCGFAEGGGAVRDVFAAAGASATLAELTPLVPGDADDPAPDVRSANAAPLLYSGEQFAPALRLQSLRARASAAPTGRFLGLDPHCGTPTEPQSLQKYRYAHDHPIGR